LVGEEKTSANEYDRQDQYRHNAIQHDFPSTPSVLTCQVNCVEWFKRGAGAEWPAGPKSLKFSMTFMVNECLQARRGIRCWWAEGR
jgi:hypothetical protein